MSPQDRPVERRDGHLVLVACAHELALEYSSKLARKKRGNEDDVNSELSI